MFKPNDKPFVMKSISLSVCFLAFFALPVAGQVPLPKWLETYGSTTTAVADIIETQSNEIVVLIDHYSSVQPFDFYGNDIVCPYQSCNTQSLVAKFSAAGQLMWYYPVSSDIGVSGKSVRIDSNGEIIAAFNRPTSEQHGLLLRLSDAGIMLDSTGVIETFHLNDMDIDSEGNIYVVGKVQGGPYSIADTVISGTGLLIVKFSPDFQPVWVRKSETLSGSPIVMISCRIDVNQNNEVTAVGLLTSGTVPATFGAIDFYGYQVSLLSYFFMVKVTSQGDVLFARGYDGVYGPIPEITTLTSDSDASVYMEGRMESGVGIDGFSLTMMNCSGNSNYDPNPSNRILIKFNGLGDVQWARNFGACTHATKVGLAVTESELFLATTHRTLPNYPNLQPPYRMGNETNFIRRGILFMGLNKENGELRWYECGNEGETGLLEVTSVAPISNGKDFLVGGELHPSNDSVVFYHHDLTTQHGGFITLIEKKSRISGKIYRDYDWSGNWSDGEPVEAQQIVRLSKQNSVETYSTTGVDGRYQFLVDSGVYTVSYLPPDNWVETSGISSVGPIIVNDTIVDHLDFGIGYTDTVVDISVRLTMPVGVVLGSSYPLWISTANNGTVSVGQSLALQIESPSQVSSFQPSTTLIIPGQLRNEMALVNTPSSAIVGASVLTTAVSGFGVEVNLEDNQDSISYEVFVPQVFAPPTSLCCPYDPNDKTLNKGFCDANYIIKGDTLEVLVRFMNTGSAPANTVVLIDTLDAQALVIEGFKPLAHSHPMTWDISGPAILTVTYDNIQLPDSSVSFWDSQGFIRYEILLKNTVPNLTHSNSSTHIFFDSEAPIETNRPNLILVDSIPTSQLFVSSTNCEGESVWIDGTISYGISIVDALWSNQYQGIPMPINEEGQYNVVLTDEYDCVFEDSIVVFCDLVTSAFAGSMDFSFTVRPNPSLAEFGVTWNATSVVDEVGVFDLSGRLLLTESVNSSSGTVDLSALSSGTYMVRMRSGQSFFTERIILQ